MHVGDLDGSSAIEGGGRWGATVTVTVHDTNEAPVANATVYLSWSGGASGSGSCVTNANGQCSITVSGIRNKDVSVTFTVTNATHASLAYQSVANHDPDGDSTGTVIVVNKP